MLVWYWCYDVSVRHFCFLERFWPTWVLTPRILQGQQHTLPNWFPWSYFVFGHLWAFVDLSGPFWVSVHFRHLRASACACACVCLATHTTRLTLCFPHGFDGKQISRLVFAICFWQFVCQARFPTRCWWGCLDARFRARFWQVCLRGSFPYAILVWFFKRLVFVRVVGRDF